MKSILLLAHDDDGQEARLQAALDLTRALGGHLHCLDVTPPPIVANGMWTTAAATIVQDQTDREAANAVRIRDRLGREDVAWSFAALRGDFADCLLEAARMADVVVLNRHVEGFGVPDMHAIVGQMLTACDTLILAVDKLCRAYDPAGPALVAWDGSAPAINAMQRAAPLLRLAASVTILQVGELAADAVGAEDAAKYLSRHGVKAEVYRVPRDGEVAQRILDAAAERRAATCVMGGYGHSRLREALFGGVTRDLLRSGDIPLLIGH